MKRTPVLNPPERRILTLDAAVQWRRQLRTDGKMVVFTNGCFDLMHRGHAQYLHQAREFGDALVVGMNSDASVRALKGPDRPVIDEYSRAYLLASLRAVDAVVIFNTARCTELLEQLIPDIYVKGGDYTEESLHPEEYRILQRNQVKINFIPLIADFSTSQLLAKLAKNA